jgi:hypothetical protein
MEGIYIFLNREEPTKNIDFLKALWSSTIKPIYKQFSRGRKIENINLEDFIAQIQSRQNQDTDSTRLVIAQQSRLSSTGRLIRFLAQGSQGIDAEFCCDYNQGNLLSVEELFLQTYGQDINSYPNQMRQP